MDLLGEPTAQERTLQILKDIAHGTLNFLHAQFDNGQRMIWSNPYGLTHQEAFDCLGTGASQMVELSRGLASFVNAMAPKSKQVVSLMPANVALTINEDGTVTVTTTEV